MTTGTGANNVNLGQTMDDGIRSWVMVVLTFIFVVLYAAALFDWLKPLADDKMVARLEPIIFVIIGYYFGRMPGQQNERTLKGEINRQAQKASEAEQQKTASEKAGEGLREKVKNTKAALASAIPSTAPTGFAATLGMPSTAVSPDSLRHAVSAALNVLDS